MEEKKFLYFVLYFHFSWFKVHKNEMFCIFFSSGLSDKIVTEKIQPTVKLWFQINKIFAQKVAKLFHRGRKSQYNIYIYFFAYIINLGRG